MGSATLSVNNIQFRHSGGAGNSDIAADLGGAISNSSLSILPLNNLFETLTPQESRDGKTDYKCFYIINTHATESLRNAKLWIESQKRGGSSISLGVEVANEVQQIVITSTGFPNEGNSFDVTVPSYSPSFTVLYDPNITQWEGNFLKEIRGVEGLAEVRVSATGEVPDVTFTVNFGGTDEMRDLGQARSRTIDNMTVDDSNLDNATATVMQLVDGSPINTTAPSVATSSVAPPGITFDLPLEGNPKQLGNLRPGDFFPVWVRRTTPANTVTANLDDFIIRINGTYP